MRYLNNKEKGIIKEIAFKELRGTLLSFKFSITFLVCFITILLSIYVGTLNYKNKLKEYHYGNELSKKTFQVYDSWESIANEGIQISMMPSPLSIFCGGISNHTGDVFTFSGFSPPSPSPSKYGRSPVLAIFGDLDLSFILRVILSLFSILYTFDAICGEKESGTLKLLLSNPIRRSQIIIGKGAGLFICLIVSFLIPMVIGLIITILTGINLGLGEWMRLGFIMFIFILFLICIFFLGFLISSITSNSNVSFLILLLIWVIFLVLAPMTSSILAGQISLIPSIQEIQSQRLMYMQEYVDGLKKETARLTEQLKSGKVTLPEFDRTHRDARKRLMNQMFIKNEKLESSIQKKQNNLNKLIVGLSISSPAASMSYATSDFAKTSVYQIEHFTNILRIHQKKFMDYIFSKFEEESLINRVFNPEYRIKINYEEIPKFIEISEPITSSLQRSVKNILSLILFSIIFFVLSYFYFIKYDPR